MEIDQSLFQFSLCYNRLACCILFVVLDPQIAQIFSDYYIILSLICVYLRNLRINSLFSFLKPLIGGGLTLGLLVRGTAHKELLGFYRESCAIPGKNFRSCSHSSLTTSSDSTESRKKRLSVAWKRRFTVTIILEALASPEMP